MFFIPFLGLLSFGLIQGILDSFGKCHVSQPNDDQFSKLLRLKTSKLNFLGKLFKYVEPFGATFTT